MKIQTKSDLFSFVIIQTLNNVPTCTTCIACLLFRSVFFKFHLFASFKVSALLQCNLLLRFDLSVSITMMKASQSIHVDVHIVISLMFPFSSVPRFMSVLVVLPERTAQILWTKLPVLWPEMVSIHFVTYFHKDKSVDIKLQIMDLFTIDSFQVRRLFPYSHDKLHVIPLFKILVNDNAGIGTCI